MSVETHCLHVDLGDRSYPILIGSGILSDPDCIRDHIVGEQVFIVSNDTVAPLYQSVLAQHISASSLSSLALPDGEQYKNIHSMGQIYDALLAEKCNRNVMLVALGGGVIGDMTGFAAATYQRGVDFVQVPTTLLAQVDSSVGGKTGVNHAAGKNMIGAFYQPKAVLIDTQTLDTLPDREYRAGLAEVIKYGFIADADFLAWLAENMERLCQRNPAALQQAIRRSCEIKAEVVAADEKEQGIRAILNLGHTFGHAIETATDYKVWLHGEAVACGMIMALDFSYRMGLIGKRDLDNACAMLRAAGLPTSPPQNIGDAKAMMSLMSLDKKVINGQIRLVLLRSPGEAFVTSDIDLALLEAMLDDYLGK